MLNLDEKAAHSDEGKRIAIIESDRFLKVVCCTFHITHFKKDDSQLCE